jgi:hypothetical protein
VKASREAPFGTVGEKGGGTGERGERPEHRAVAGGRGEDGGGDRAGGPRNGGDVVKITQRRPACAQ